MLVILFLILAYSALFFWYIKAKNQIRHDSEVTHKNIESVFAILDTHFDSYNFDSIKYTQVKDQLYALLEEPIYRNGKINGHMLYPFKPPTQLIPEELLEPYRIS